MSTHPVTNPVNIIEGLPGLRVAVTAAIRAPSDVQWDGSSVVYVFTPDLTSAEATTFTGVVADVRGAANTSSILLTLAEYQAIKPDLAGLRTYAGIASPTLAQTASAVKAQSRVLRALIRD